MNEQPKTSEDNYYPNYLPQLFNSYLTAETIHHLRHIYCFTETGEEIQVLKKLIPFATLAVYSSHPDKIQKLDPYTKVFPFNFLHDPLFALPNSLGVFRNLSVADESGNIPTYSPIPGIVISRSLGFIKQNGQFLVTLQQATEHQYLSRAAQAYGLTPIIENNEYAPLQTINGIVSRSDGYVLHLK